MIDLGGSAHLWFVRSDGIREKDLLAACCDVLTADEVAESNRFHFPEGRHQHLLARLLLRSVLSEHASVPPRAWRFVRDSHSRPSVAAPASERSLRFNLSHTPGLVACLVARDLEVGVDVEDVTPADGTLELADRFFAPCEASALRRLPEGSRGRRFLEYWTLKESYIKARGLGLAIPLDRFWFELGGDPSPVVMSLDPRDDDEAGHWQFSLFRPSPWHVMAAAIRKGPGEPISIEMHERRAI